MSPGLILVQTTKGAKANIGFSAFCNVFYILFLNMILIYAYWAPYLIILFGLLHTLLSIEDSRLPVESLCIFKSFYQRMLIYIFIMNPGIGLLIFLIIIIIINKIHHSIVHHKTTWYNIEIWNRIK